MSEISNGSDDLIKSIKEIFFNTNPYYKFNIPEYQRGYKWTDKDVELLLNDVMKFHNENHNSDEFYCLQNITLVKNGDMYNVVDGQQRLTTVYIILAYIKSRIEDASFNNLNDKLLYSIEHNVSVIGYGNNSCKELIRKDLLDNKYWQEFKFTPSKINSKDQYYILQVADKVKKWFETNLSDSENFNGYINTFQNRVKFIVNEVEGNEETIFANLNGGKVPLDGADLIRAIIITKAAKEKFETPDKERINEYRVRLGMELDSINRWWETSDVQDFFKLLLPKALIKNSSFDFKKYPINYLYAIYFMINEKNEEKDLSLDFFETGVDHDTVTSNDHFEMYMDIVQLHYVLKDWYEDFKIYHFLGYLFKNFKNILYREENKDKSNVSDKITLRNIYKKWTDCKSKQEFIVYLKELIKKNLLSSLCKENDDFDSAFEELKNAILNTKMNWYDYDLTIPLLSLLDVIYAFKSERKERIPLTYLSCGPEDKEHINPQADKEKLGECENSIGNIVLLDSSINRSYKDDSFDKKLNRIISEYFANKAYVRLFTFNVFLQKIKEEKSETGLSKEITWTEQNVKDNTKKIVKDLEKFFKEM